MEMSQVQEYFYEILLFPDYHMQEMRGGFGMLLI